MARQFNTQGAIVDSAWYTAEAPDNAFRDLVYLFVDQTIARSDHGFREQEALSNNLMDCHRGTWNERFTRETDVSWLTERRHAKNCIIGSQPIWWPIYGISQP